MGVVMKKHTTEIAFILDRSGSMASLTEAAITGFNEFLRSQQNVPGAARMTLVLFDNEYLVPVQSIPIEEVIALDTTTYVPRGSTALLDAVGETIDRLGARLAATEEGDRPAQVIVAILTDGYENSSTRFTWAEVSRRILEQTNVYKWHFLFLGANQDAIATAAQLNIGAGNAATYVADGVGTVRSSAAMARKTTALRKFAAAMPMNLQETADAVAPLTEIVKEEDAKGRGK